MLAETIAPVVRAYQADVARLDVELRRRGPSELEQLRTALEQRATRCKADPRAERNVSSSTAVGQSTAARDYIPCCDRDPKDVASALMVFLFTLCTMFAVVALQWTPYRITASQVAEGLSFRLPPLLRAA